MINLIKLAATTKPSTKVAAKAALKAAGLKQTLSDALLAQTVHLNFAKRIARMSRTARKLGYIPVAPDNSINGYSAIYRAVEVATGREIKIHNAIGGWLHWRDPSHGTPSLKRAVSLGKGPISDRLNIIRRDQVRREYNALYRSAEHGECTIVLTGKPTEVGVTQREYQSWGYAKSYKHPMRHQDTALTVPFDWRIRVQRRGLARLDGMLTLDAAPLEGSPDGVFLYAATWLTQGRGNSVASIRGYIATDLVCNYHADTAEAALTGLKRKLKAKRSAAEWEAILRHANLDDLVASAPGAIVRIADATAIGACDYGIRSWCHTVCINYDAGQAIVADVYAAYRREPRVEARAAILHALRRQRKAT